MRCIRFLRAVDRSAIRVFVSDISIPEYPVLHDIDGSGRISMATSRTNVRPIALGVNLSYSNQSCTF